MVEPFLSELLVVYSCQHRRMDALTFVLIHRLFALNAFCDRQTMHSNESGRLHVLCSLRAMVIRALAFISCDSMCELGTPYSRYTIRPMELIRGCNPTCRRFQLPEVKP